MRAGSNTWRSVHSPSMRVIRARAALSQALPPSHNAAPRRTHWYTCATATSMIGAYACCSSGRFRPVCAA